MHGRIASPPDYARIVAVMQAVAMHGGCSEDDLRALREIEPRTRTSQQQFHRAATTGWTGGTTDSWKPW